MLNPDAQLSDALRWALEDVGDASMASADWLARDIRPSCDGVVALLVDDAVSLHELSQAKSVYKTMRIVGETSSDRRLAARLYVAAIAAALVKYERRISTQSDKALERGLTGLSGDDRMPSALRELGRRAIGKLRGGGVPQVTRRTTFDDPEALPM